MQFVVGAVSSPPPFVLICTLSFALCERFFREGCGEDTAPTTFANSPILELVLVRWGHRTYYICQFSNSPILDIYGLEPVGGSCCLRRRCGALAATIRAHAVPHRRLASFRLTFLLPFCELFLRGVRWGHRTYYICQFSNSPILEFNFLRRSEGSCCLRRRCGVLTATLRAYAVPHRRLPPFRLIFLLPFASDF